MGRVLGPLDEFLSNSWMQGVMINEFTAARKYVERAERGLPSDRWVDGAEGAAQLVVEIKTLFSLVSELSSAAEGLYEEVRRRDDRVAENMGVIRETE